MLNSGAKYGEIAALADSRACTFVLITGAPCSGKSTFIQNNKPDTEALFALSGFQDDRVQVATLRRTFIREHKRKGGRAWIEACALTPALAKDLSHARFIHIPMTATLKECLSNLAKSDRQNKERWEWIIKKYYPSKANPRYKNGAARVKARARVKSWGRPCALCGQAINYDLAAGDPMSFEVDEIVPISLGGSATDITNLQPAHRICNQKKGNRMNVVTDPKHIKAQGAPLMSPTRTSIAW